MKAMKKTITLLLAVVLVASAFCLEAFASSRTKYGTFNGRDWSTKLTVGNFSVSGSIGYNGTNKDSVNVKYWVDCNWGSYWDVIPGTRTASFYFAPKSDRIVSVDATYRINNTKVNSYDDVTP